MFRLADFRRFLLVPAFALALVSCGGSGGGGGDDGGTAPPPLGNEPPPPSGGTVDTTPPSVPTGFEASASSPTQVQLSWAASTDSGVGVAGYRLYRDGSSTPLANVTVTHYTDTGLTANTAYVYTLRAYDAASPANESELTSAVSVTTPPAPPDGDSIPPTTPTNVTAIPTSTTSIQISWSPSTDASGIAEYRVYREGTSVAIAVTQNTTFTDTQREPNTTYTYFVTAVDGATPSNESARSDPASATTGPGTTPGDTTPPTVPGNVRADARSSSTIRIRWEASRDQSGIAEYRIYRNGGATPVGTSTDLEFRDTNLVANTTYQYTVTAVDKANPPNESAHSRIVTATTDAVGPGPGDTSPPAPPQNLTATARSSTEIDLNWSPSTDPSGIREYTVYRDGGTTPVATVQTTTFTDTGLTPGTQYSYTVRATDNAATPNTSVDSAPATATTNAPPVIDDVPPAPPENLMATARSSTEIDLSWSPASDPSGIREYSVYRNGAPEPVATVQTTTYTDGGLEPGTQYSYTVRATDNAPTPNTSADSLPATATTNPPPVIDFTPPTVPQNLVAVTQGSRSIELHWDPSTDDESGILNYRVYRSEGPGPGPGRGEPAIATVTTPNYVDNDLQPDTRYRYKVRAVDRAPIPNISRASEEASARTLPE